MTFLAYPPKRDSLLCVARHKAVTLTWDAPLSKALRPGLSVSEVEPSGVCFSWYCQPSSRSLGHSLLLGQRSRLNFLSDLVRSLFHQHHRRPHTEFVSHRYNSDSRTEMTGMFFGHGAKEFSQLAVLADRRPRSLDKLTSQSSVTGVSNRAALGSLPGGVLGGNQTQKSRQLADVFDLAPVPNARHKLAGHDPADPGKCFQILDTLRQFRVGLAKAADLSGHLKDLLLVKLQTVEQPIELKAHGGRTGKFPQFLFHQERPLTAGRSRGKLQSFHEQQRFNALFHSRHLADQGVAQLGQMAQLPIQGRRNMDAFELSATKILRDPSAIEPIGLHSLSGRFGNHRRRSDQARISLGLQPIIQSVARGSSLIGKRHLLIGIVLTNVVHKMFDLVRHVQRLKKSLVIDKRYRDTFLVHIESGKYIVVTRYERLGSHRSASLVQRLNFRPLYLVLSTRGEPRHPSYRSLRELGYIEGQNIAIEYRYAEGKVDRAPELAAELVRLKVDAIVVAGGTPSVQSAMNATKTIPIVMMGQGSDPVRAGLVESLARPGGNVTGLTALGRELGGKRLELLKEAIPKLSRVAVLYDPANPPSLHEVKELLPADARALKLTIRVKQQISVES
jgi:ABC transporter substrate binding protein